MEISISIVDSQKKQSMDINKQKPKFVYKKYPGKRPRTVWGE